jgi:hypothetical protein
MWWIETIFFNEAHHNSNICFLILGYLLNICDSLTNIQTKKQVQPNKHKVEMNFSYKTTSIFIVLTWEIQFRNSKSSMFIDGVAFHLL